THAAAPTTLHRLIDGRNGNAAVARDHVVPISVIEPTLGQLPNEVSDDRDYIRPCDKVLLIIENDLAFSRFLLDTAREAGWKGLVSSRGAAGLALTREYKPDAITLDINLPDIDGWRVLE